MQQIDMEKFANKLFDEFYYNGKTIRDWVNIILTSDAVSRQEVLKNISDDDSDLYDKIKTMPSICINSTPKFVHGSSTKIEESL